MKSRTKKIYKKEPTKKEPKQDFNKVFNEDQLVTKSKTTAFFKLPKHCLKLEEDDINEDEEPDNIYSPNSNTRNLDNIKKSPTKSQACIDKNSLEKNIKTWIPLNIKINFDQTNGNVEPIQKKKLDLRHSKFVNSLAKRANLLKSESLNLSDDGQNAFKVLITKAEAQRKKIQKILMKDKTHSKTKLQIKKDGLYDSLLSSYIDNSLDMNRTNYQFGLQTARTASKLSSNLNTIETSYGNFNRTGYTKTTENKPFMNKLRLNTESAYIDTSPRIHSSSTSRGIITVRSKDNDSNLVTKERINVLDCLAGDKFKCYFKGAITDSFPERNKPIKWKGNKIELKNNMNFTKSNNIIKGNVLLENRAKYFFGGVHGQGEERQVKSGTGLRSKTGKLISRNSKENKEEDIVMSNKKKEIMKINIELDDNYMLHMNTNKKISTQRVNTSNSSKYMKKDDINLGRISNFKFYE